MKLGIKGQGTLEYLIILAVVLVIAFVAATQIFNLGGSQQINEQESKLYWARMTPLSIPQYSITSSGSQIVLQNSLSETVTIKDFNLGDVSIDAGTVTIGPGAKQTISGDGVKCTVGQTFSYSVKILYDTESLTDVPLSGTKDLVGNCSG